MHVLPINFVVSAEEAADIHYEQHVKARHQRALDEAEEREKWTRTIKDKPQTTDPRWSGLPELGR